MLLRSAIGVGLFAIAIAAAFAIKAATDDPSTNRAEVLAYQERLLPLAQEWGRIEVQGMRPAISDLQAGEGVPPETVAGEARAWHAGFASIRAEIVRLKTPRRLEEARRLFDESIVRYLASAKAFEAAADGPVDRREAGIKAGIEEAREGARLYNEASLVLQAVRKEVGLAPTDDFPNHKAGRAGVGADGPSAT